MLAQAHIKGIDHPMLSDSQRVSAVMCAERESVTECEVWYDETDSTMGLTMVEDGAYLTAYFDRDGRLIGDWIV